MKELQHTVPKADRLLMSDVKVVYMTYSKGNLGGWGRAKNTRCSYTEGILAISTTDRAVLVRHCTLKSLSLTSSLLYILYISYL